MTDYSKSMINSDLDAFKNSGAVLTAAISFGGAIGAGSEHVRTAQITVASPDFAQILFDSSTKHSGKFKSLQLSPYTMIHESTRDSELGCDLTIIVSGNIVTLRGSVFNPYDTTVSLDATTINFRYIPYEATI